LCDHLISRALFKDGSKCPHCRQELYEPTDVIMAVDSDGDGIPDEDEKRFGLDPANAEDGNEDMDGDGFSNAVEFLGQAGATMLNKKSDLTNPKDHPSLVYRLYFEGAKSKPLTFTIDKVDTYGDKEKLWSVYFMVRVRGKQKPYIKGVGEELTVNKVKYKVEKIVKKSETIENKTTKGKETRDVSEVYLSSTKYPGKEIVGRAKKRIMEPGQLITLTDVADSKSFTVNLEDEKRTIVVGDENVGTEVFVVKDMNKDGDSVAVVSEDGSVSFNVSKKENMLLIGGSASEEDVTSDAFEPSF